MSDDKVTEKLCEERMAKVEEMSHHMETLIQSQATLTERVNNLIDKVLTITCSEKDVIKMRMNHNGKLKSLSAQTGFQWIAIVIVLGIVGWLTKTVFALSNLVASMQHLFPK